jgi:hypothetical protein
MKTRAFIAYPASDNGKGEIDVDTIWCRIGETRVKLMIHGGEFSPTLSDWRTGYRFCDLRQTRLQLMWKYGHKPRLRDLAQHAVDNVVARNGAEKVLAVMAEKPALNV